MKSTRKHQTIKFSDGKFTAHEDLLASESLLTLVINDKEVLSLYCTPLMVRELVVGLVMTEGIADGICTERMTVNYSDEGIRVELHAEGEVRMDRGTVTSGCVGGLSFAGKDTNDAASDNLTVNATEMIELFGRFQKRSELHARTGCVHSAAIAEPQEGIVAFAEDIGRHNAVDKAIGYTLLEGMDFKGKMMMASGRLSSEITSKCSKWGIPIVISRAAPTALAVDIAEKSGLTLVGFLRGRHFNVYTHPHRITA